jgi:hypothetical protein
MRKHSIDFVATLDSNFQAALTSAVALRVGAKRDGCVLIWLGTDVLIDSRQKRHAARREAQAEHALVC